MINNSNKNNNAEYNETVALLTILMAQGYREENPNPNSYLSLLDNNRKFNPLLVDKERDIGSILLQKKIPAFGLKIVPPDWLVLVITFCAGGNPGFIQMIYKELLNFINSTKFGGTGLPDNYKITTRDFADCFLEYPIIMVSEIEERYTKMWDNQKRETTKTFESDNMCDTPEYWLKESHEYWLIHQKG